MSEGGDINGDGIDDLIVGAYYNDLAATMLVGLCGVR